MPTLERAVLLVLVTSLFGCGAGPYGYARHYVPLGDEDDAYDAATPVTYEEVRRGLPVHRGALVGWFGVVTRVEPAARGAGVTVHLTHRAHQERHLCRDETQGSCRVTVSEREGGPFSVTLELRPEDRDGAERVWEGSLLKVYGVPTGELDAEGGPILRPRYYRHWPSGRYVTTGAARSMRR